MDNSESTLQCQNLTCLAANPVTHQFCQKCGIPLVRRYLRVIGNGDWVKTYYRPGTILEERYLFLTPQIVLDTKPALPPQAPEEFPAYITPYLKLFPHRLHIPQIYGYIPTPDEQIDMSVWFLEYGTVPTDESGGLVYPDLLPQLTEVWPQATPIRQLSWLWQMAQLWQPLESKGAVSTLFNSALLRVNARFIQILELELNSDKTFTLKDLGKLWSQWIQQASPNIRDCLTQLCVSLEQAHISRPEQLIAILDQAIYQSGQSQKRTYQIFTATDTGKLREHNEDACYPLGGNEVVSVDEQHNPLAIVCDGIGGQEGGEIASNLAIETLCREMARFYESNIWNPESHTRTIEKAIGSTNDVICQRNDRENRQERQRMGTTVVLGLGHAHEMYIAHVGDSRIYWITPNSCHQVTVDDDLASREVRLGYLLYRDAVQYPNAGALVQALGMSGATTLHPTVGRLIIDEDCVFLLCSDGLSDYDRVDQFWQTEIVPVLTQNKNLAEVGEQLINIANEKNGHDNVTIALIHCQVQLKEGMQDVPLSFADLESSVSYLSGPTIIEDILPEEPAETAITEMPTVPSFGPEVTDSDPKPSRPISTLWMVLGLLALCAVGAGVYWGQQWFFPSSNHPSPTISPLSTQTPSPLSPPVQSPNATPLKSPNPSPSVSGASTTKSPSASPSASPDRQGQPR